MTSTPDSLQSLQALIDTQILPAARSGFTLSACDADGVTLDAPLAPNVNDKGCAFGGTLVSAMTLAGWALIMQLLRQRGWTADVFVARSEVAYRAPVWQDFRAHAWLTADTHIATACDELAARSKTRLQVNCRVHEMNTKADCATLSARFAARTRDHQ